MMNRLLQEWTLSLCRKVVGLNRYILSNKEPYPAFQYALTGPGGAFLYLDVLYRKAVVAGDRVISSSLVRDRGPNFTKTRIGCTAVFLKSEF